MRHSALMSLFVQNNYNSDPVMKLMNIIPITTELYM